jgi:hypothetical protein
MERSLHIGAVDYIIQFLREPRDEDVVHFIIIAENLPCFAHSFAALYGLCQLHVKYVSDPDIARWIEYHAHDCAELVNHQRYRAMQDAVLTDFRVDLAKLEQYLKR